MTLQMDALPPSMYGILRRPHEEPPLPSKRGGLKPSLPWLARKESLVLP